MQQFRQVAALIGAEWCEKLIADFHLEVVHA
jgi:hypothetical protein